MVKDLLMIFGRIRHSRCIDRRTVNGLPKTVLACRRAELLDSAEISALLVAVDIALMETFVYCTTFIENVKGRDGMSLP